MGSATQTGLFAVGSCTNLDFYSAKLTPHDGAGEPRNGRREYARIISDGHLAGAHCSVTFWNAAGCGGAESEVVQLVNNEQSGCIKPTFNGTFEGMFPEEIEAKSVQVDCIFI